jgi:hypothetical protein
MSKLREELDRAFKAAKGDHTKAIEAGLKVSKKLGKSTKVSTIEAYYWRFNKTGSTAKIENPKKKWKKNGWKSPIWNAGKGKKRAVKKKAVKKAKSKKPKARRSTLPKEHVTTKMRKAEADYRANPSSYGGSKEMHEA